MTPEDIPTPAPPGHVTIDPDDPEWSARNLADQFGSDEAAVEWCRRTMLVAGVDDAEDVQ